MLSQSDIVQRDGQTMLSYFNLHLHIMSEDEHLSYAEELLDFLVLCIVRILF